MPGLNDQSTSASTQSSDPCYSQPGWRESNSRPFAPLSAVEFYGSPHQVGCGEACSSYRDLLHYICTRPVLDCDYFSIVQNGDFHTGPLDLERPWISTFKNKDVLIRPNISLDNLSTYLNFPPNFRTKAIHCESASDNSILISTLIHEIVSPLRRDETFSMLSLNVHNTLMAPNWVERNCIDLVGEVFTCKHEQRFSSFQYFIQACAAGAYTHTHVDFSGTGAVICVLEGEKYLALAPQRQNSLKRIAQQTSRWFFDDFLPKEAPVFGVKLLPGQVVYIPSGWLHAVLSSKASLQAGYNFLPTYAIPRIITHWSFEVYSNLLPLNHSDPKSKCTGLCSCEPSGGVSAFPQRLIRYLRFLPPLHTNTARTIKGFLIRVRGVRVLYGLCETCFPLEDTLQWLQSQCFAKPVKARLSYIPVLS
jgi:hypothetical protein